MTISEKAAYIKGLAEGCALSTETNEGKVLHAVIDLLGDIGAKLVELEENDINLGDDIDAISDDLSDIEEIVYEDDDDDFYCGDDNCCCDDDFMGSVECPSCGEEIMVDESILAAGKLECPACGEKLELEIDDDEEDDFDAEEDIEN